MFNNPRPSTNPSVLRSSSAFNPLDPAVADLAAAHGGGGGTNAVSQYGEVDPWSGTATPVSAKSGPADLFTDPPEQYMTLFRQLDPSPEGTVSVAAVQRLISSTSLPAVTVDKIVSQTCPGIHAGRNEIFSALALVALAQQSTSTDPSLSDLANLHSLPLPFFPSTTYSSIAPAQPPLLSPSGFTSPWDTSLRSNGVTMGYGGVNGSGGGSTSEGSGGGSGMFDPGESEKGYWRRLENVEVSLIPEKEGWFLQKYRLESDKRPEPITRRYSDFVWLIDCLTKRYPFRLLPALPPKKMGPDAIFLEQRRKGLKRFINSLINHPVLRDDGALNVFLTEKNFEAWRKRVKVSTEEESMSKKLNPAQEMAIPSDLDDRLDLLRKRLPNLIASYQKMVTLTERSLSRLQASSADASRLALSLQSVAEEMPAACYRCIPGARSRGCDLCEGVGQGLAAYGDVWSRLAEERERQAMSVIMAAIEALKTQRDLYIAFRDLFIRHERLSKDNVDALRKKVETRGKKIETLRIGQKPGFEAEIDKLVSATEQDNSTITSLLSRRVFIRACMWHELAVVCHSRQSAQIIISTRAWVAGETGAVRAELGIWESVLEDVERMPLD